MGTLGRALLILWQGTLTSLTGHMLWRCTVRLFIATEELEYALAVEGLKGKCSAVPACMMGEVDPERSSAALPPATSSSACMLGLHGKPRVDQ